MKYSKIINKNIIDIGTYTSFVIFFIMLYVMFVFFSGVFKGTNASFGGMTGALSPVYTVSYYSNWPDSFISDELDKFEINDSYVVLNNMFTVPDGFQFIGWSTFADGTGEFYVADDTLSLSSNVDLYAQWELISDINDEKKDSEDNEEKENDDENLDSDNNSSGSGSNNSSGNGGGSGNGNPSNGSTSNNNVNNSSGNNGFSNNNYIGGNNDLTNDKNEEVQKVITYEFKFISDNIEFAKTGCDTTTEDKTCSLILPKDNPIKDGYKFMGWSANINCSSKDIITDSVIVNKSNIYYACFRQLIDAKISDNSWIYIIISVWIIAGIAIYFAIRRFKSKEVEG